MTEAPSFAAPPAPEAPALDITKTPEFLAAVQQAAAKAAAEAVAATMAAQRSADGTPLGIAEQLAMAIATLTSQNNGGKLPVSPEKMRARAEAGERMHALLMEVHAGGPRPVYALRSQTYLGEILINPVYRDPRSHEVNAVEIEWPHTPNGAMVPVNDIAKAIHHEYLGSVGEAIKIAGVYDGPMTIKGNGLVVRGDPSKDGSQKNRRGPGVDTAAEVGLTVRNGRGDSGYKPIHILGTIAPPALQSV